jgi:hypothetical protein
MTLSEGLLQKYDPKGVFVVLQDFQLNTFPAITAVSLTGTVGLHGSIESKKVEPIRRHEPPPLPRLVERS